MRSFRWSQVLAMRLERGYLAQPWQGSDPSSVVRAVGALQSQVAAAAELGVGVRCSDVSQQDVRAMVLDRRSLVRTYGLRNTIHLFASAELPLWMAAMRAATHWRDSAWYEERELDPARTDALFSAFREALAGGPLTRARLAAAVAERAGRWAHDRLASQWADLIDAACFAGVACYGPSGGSTVTFVRPDLWLGHWEEPDEQEALLEVLRRFLAAYGPARLRDFAGWLTPHGMRSGEADALFHRLNEDIVEVETEGKRAWMLATDAEREWEPVGPSVSLLPQYDAYVLGCRFGREHVVPREVRSLMKALGRRAFEGAVQSPLLLIDGRVAGIWERRTIGGEIALTVHPLDALRPVHADLLERSSARIGEFYESPWRLEIRPPFSS